MLRCLFSLSLSLSAMVLQSPWDRHLQWEFMGGQYLTLLSHPDFSCLCYTLFTSSSDILAIPEMLPLAREISHFAS